MTRERCKAMVTRRDKTSGRCQRNAKDEGLCWTHLRSGAVIPDEWTEPDNLPVFIERMLKAVA